MLELDLGDAGGFETVDFTSTFGEVEEVEEVISGSFVDSFLEVCTCF